MISSSLVIIGAQRLVRRLCPECKEAYEATLKLKSDFGIKQDLLYKPKGCDYCSHIGYKGRVAIYEIIVLNDQLRELISKGAGLGEIKKVTKEMGVKSLFDKGVKKVEEGVTSIEEILSITMAAGYAM